MTEIANNIIRSTDKWHSHSNFVFRARYEFDERKQLPIHGYQRQAQTGLCGIYETYKLWLFRIHGLQGEILHKVT